MRCKLPYLLIVGLCCTFPQVAPAQTVGIGECRFEYRMENRNRKVLAPNQGVHINAECFDDRVDCFPIYPHTIPWGNWGVSSNVGTKKDGKQFEGWDPGGQKREWNSCTSDFPPPDCLFYNAASCTQQATSTGANAYGGGLLSQPARCDVGCSVYNGTTLTVSQNFMTLYELDPCDEDELVQSMIFPDVSVTLSCDYWNCTAVRSSWVGPTSYNTPVWPPLVDAQISLFVVRGWYNDTNCITDCLPCVGNECTPCQQ